MFLICSPLGVVLIVGNLFWTHLISIQGSDGFWLWLLYDLDHSFALLCFIFSFLLATCSQLQRKFIIRCIAQQCILRNSAGFKFWFEVQVLWYSNLILLLVWPASEMMRWPASSRSTQRCYVITSHSWFSFLCRIFVQSVQKCTYGRMIIYQGSVHILWYVAFICLWISQTVI